MQNDPSPVILIGEIATHIPFCFAGYFFDTSNAYSITTYAEISCCGTLKCDEK